MNSASIAPMNFRRCLAVIGIMTHLFFPLGMAPDVVAEEDGRLEANVPTIPITAEFPTKAQNTTTKTIELTAKGSIASEVAASTVGAGSHSSPRSLLTGMHDVWPSEGTEHVGKVLLQAFSNAQLSAQTFPADPVWTVAGGGAGNFEGLLRDAPRTASGTETVFYAEDPGLYVFTATVDSYGSASISVYVAEPEITVYPSYIFGKAQGRVPFEFGLAGNSCNFRIEMEKPFRWVLQEPELEFQGAETQSYRELRNYGQEIVAFAPTFGDTSSHNGTSATYCAVSDDQPLSNYRDFYEPGMLEIRMGLSFTAAVLVPDKGFTNFAQLTSTLRPTAWNEVPGSERIRVYDSRWNVVPVGEETSISLAYVTATGLCRFHHLATDDNGYYCAGRCTNSGTSIEGASAHFKANDFGDPEAYDAPSEIHYHPGDVSITTGGPRGFDEEGAGEDVAVAGITRDLDADGMSVETRLFDDTDPWSDDEEVYKASVMGASATTLAAICYTTRTSGHFGSFYDTRAESISANLHPVSFAGVKLAKVLLNTDVNTTARVIATGAGILGLATGGGCLYATLRTATKVGTFITFVTSSPVSACIFVASIISLFVITSDPYDQATADAEIRSLNTVASWTDDDGEARVNRQDDLIPFDASEVTLASSGIWQNAMTVSVGEKVMSGMMFFCVAQNRSRECNPTNDVSATAKIINLNAPTYDIRSIKYQWEE